MPLVADLDLPELDLLDPSLRGERWHRTMLDLRDGGEWLARAPLAVVVANARAIVEGHGGRIWLADSDAGTCVRFVIPT